MSGNPPAGYYADPSIPGYIRYWDGATWVPGTSRPAPDESGGGEIQDRVEDARASSPGVSAAAAAGDSGAWRPEPALSASQHAQASAAAQAEAARNAREQYEQQAVAQAQVRAEQARAQQAQAAVQAQAQQALAQQAWAQQQPQAVPEQFQQQYAPQQPAIPAQQPYPQPPGPQIPQQYPPNPQQPAYPAEQPPVRPESVAGMVVPSAFAARNATGTYAYGLNPFAGLPGSPSADAAAGEAETTVLELATPGSRFLARMIDLGIAAVFSAPITVSLLLVAHRHDHQYVLNLDAQATTTYTTLGMDGMGIALWGGAAVALVLVAIVYEGYRLGRGGQTAGKRLAGIRVVRLADASALRGGGLGLRRALLFWILAVLPLIDLLALGGVLWGRPYRQGLHERVTSTATVKA